MTTTLDDATMFTLVQIHDRVVGKPLVLTRNDNEKIPKKLIEEILQAAPGLTIVISKKKDMLIHDLMLEGAARMLSDVGYFEGTLKFQRSKGSSVVEVPVDCMRQETYEHNSSRTLDNDGKESVFATALKVYPRSGTDGSAKLAAMPFFRRKTEDGASVFHIFSLHGDELPKKTPFYFETSGMKFWFVPEEAGSLSKPQVMVVREPKRFPNPSGTELMGLFFEKREKKNAAPSSVESATRLFPGVKPVSPELNEKKNADGQGHVSGEDDLDFSKMRFDCEVEMKWDGRVMVFPAVCRGVDTSDDRGTKSVEFFFHVLGDKVPQGTPMYLNKEKDEWVFSVFYTPQVIAKLRLFLAGVKKALLEKKAMSDPVFVGDFIKVTAKV